MPTCKTCQLEKREDEFSLRKDSGHLRTDCKKCRNEKQNLRHSEFKRSDPEGYEKMLALKRSGKPIGGPLRRPSIEPSDWAPIVQEWLKTRREDATDFVWLRSGWEAWLNSGSISFFAIVLAGNKELFRGMQYRWRLGQDQEWLAKSRVKNMIPEVKARRGAQRLEARKCPKKLEESRKKGRDYFMENKERVYEYRKEQRRTNPDYKIACNLRTYIYQHVGKKTTRGESRFRNIVGCSVADLRKHLESKFKDGMSWANYSREGWHIDHIMPVAHFNLTDESQQRQCFHWSNLQPLWAEENRSKSDNMIDTMAATVRI